MEEVDCDSDSTAVDVILVVGPVIWPELSEIDDNIPLDGSVAVFIVLD